MGRLRVFGALAVAYMVGALLVATFYENNDLATVGGLCAVAAAILAHLE